MVSQSMSRMRKDRHLEELRGKMVHTFWERIHNENVLIFFFSMKLQNWKEVVPVLSDP